MSDVGDNNFMRYVYRGEEDEVIPEGATHITVHEDVRVIRSRAFISRRNIVEVICHEDVEKIEHRAFAFCPRLRRVIMPGVKIVEACAFNNCRALTDVECGKLEIIGGGAFSYCTLRSINLPSARIVKGIAFGFCTALTNAKFGSKLEKIVGEAFWNCTSLERIAIPLKDGMITVDGIFKGCEKLKQVDLVEGELHETIAALQSEEWRNDMNKEIDAINQSLPSVNPGHSWRDDDEGEKAVAIRDWIRSVLGKMIEYKEQHSELLYENVAPILQLVLPQDILMNNVLPFLELPSYSFEVENHEEGEEEDSVGDEE